MLDISTQLHIKLHVRSAGLKTQHIKLWTGRSWRHLLLLVQYARGQSRLPYSVLAVQSGGLEFVSAIYRIEIFAKP